MSTAPFPLSFHNTMSGRVERFVPLDGTTAGIYFCGPTVYNDAHIGNLRTYIFSDVLRRTIALAGYSVESVMNITDVGHLTGDADDGQDKLQLSARDARTTAWEIAERYTALFFHDCELLNITRAQWVLRATDTIAEQVDLIRRLEAKGVTYRTDDGLYFDTSLISDYGKLTPGDSRDELLAGNRVAVGGKRHPTDFALWKLSPDDRPRRDMEWDSPWGVGFPGWHIECSAMAISQLGDTLDIHVGGVDHIPIHHTNEIAQSETATGHPFARFWLHGAFLTISDDGRRGDEEEERDGERMAKSAGNFVTVRDLQAQGFDPLDFRYLCLTSHYRSELRFSIESLRSAGTARERLARRARDLRDQLHGEPELPDDDPTWIEVRDALGDDLNTARALAAVWTRLRADDPDPSSTVGMIAAADEVLALDLLAGHDDQRIPEDVVALADQRIQSRAAGDYAAADKLRDEIRAAGYRIRDTRDGYTFEPL